MLTRFSLRNSATYSAALSVAIVSGSIGGGSAGAAEAPATTATADVVPAETVMYTLLLLRDSAVRSELQLSPEQVLLVEALIAKIEYPLFLLRDVPAKDRGAGLVPIQSTLHEKLATALSASQRTRLDQLVFQARGSTGITSPENIKRLSLTDDQVARIKKIQESATSELANVKTVGAAQATKETAESRNRPATKPKEFEAVIGLLNARQRTAVAGMRGQEFNLSHVKWVATTAPQFRNIETWINSEPIQLNDLRGKVVIIHFWAFGCINCLRNLPHYQQWYTDFSPAEVTIIGIHTPETVAERSTDNLRTQVAKRGIKYPVAFDAGSDNWRAWGNHLWPSVYLVDKQGRVRQWWYGELNWQGGHGEELMRHRIQELIEEK